MAQRRDKVQATLWHADDLAGAELLRGRFTDYSYDVHTHDKACFALITRGAIRIRMRGGEFVARQGDLYAIDADVPHAGWPIDGAGWSQRTLYVDIEQLKRLVEDDAPSKRAVAITGPIIRDGTLGGLLGGVHRCSETGGPPLEREDHYLDFVTRLFERHTRAAPHMAPAGNEERAIRLARDFLDAHLDARVRLGDIASAAGLPPFRLFRAFARATGMSPHGYQRQARVRFATGLLRRGHALGDVAAASGFADQAHLTRTFRRTMGLTPGAYKAAFATGTSLR